MAVSNRDRVERVMDALKQGLGPFVIREYKMTYKGQKYIDEIDRALTSGAYQLPEEALHGEATLLEHIDVQGWLNLMQRRWNEVFQAKLGKSERGYVGELSDYRNDWAHQKPFTNEEAYRVADTASRLLKSISAANEAKIVDETAQELLRLRFEADAEKSKKTNGKQAQEVTTLAGLQPWRNVIAPHPDVTSGRYIPSDFAADLAQVLDGKASPEYQDPVEFFKRTYITEGLMIMLTTGVMRLTSQGGEPVVQLKTSFGGGKTHSMLALYHLSGGGLHLSDFPDGVRLAEHIGNIDLPQATRAVLVGTALDPTQPIEYPECTVHTLWGELAYQIGWGAGGRQLEAYKMVETADLAGTSPGGNTLLKLLQAFGPCLIIVDELVAYARNLYGTERLTGGTFDSVMTFMQSLTEAVKRSDDSLLLISLPESDIEKGGEAGREALDMLEHTVGRVESVWKPVTASESFEIVRRRLFTQSLDYAARDAVIDEFIRMYRDSAGEFPSGVSERDYQDRMRAAYPIHPEMFDRLYQDWSTLDRFQRTRGVLRLMADIIRELWTRGDQSLLIMPGTVPLDATRVRNEIMRYLPDTWTAVLDRDIDGQESVPFNIDATVPILGKYTAARRVARAVFIGSAPSVAAQSVRGLEEVRIRLACAQPGEQLSTFGDALRRMSSLLTYFYTDGSRYWYDTRPTVNKMARDRAQRFPDEEVTQELINRLRKESDEWRRKFQSKAHFAAYHVCPPNTADVVDEARARVVLLDPETTHKRGSDKSSAFARVPEFLERRGNAQRLYKNMLVFIAADQDDMDDVREAAKEYMAWKSIRAEEEALNLDAQQRRQVSDSLKRLDETVEMRLREAYNWLIVPTQPEPLGDVVLQATKISGSDSFYERAGRKIRQDSLLIDDWSPEGLNMEVLTPFLWNREQWEVSLRDLWEYLAQYVYLPRLFDQDVLVGAVQDGAARTDAPFAYATSVDSEGYHTGVVYCAPGRVYSDDSSLLVHPDYIRVRAPRAPELPPVPGAGDNVTGGGPGSGVTPPHVVKPRVKSRYYGRVQVDPKRASKKMNELIDEVIQHLTSLVDCDVEISVEINATRPSGFDDTTCRVIRENTRTLGFEISDFEEE